MEPKSKKLAKRAYSRSRYMRTGTNPTNAVTFRGYGFPDMLTTNIVYGETLALDPSTATPIPFTVFDLASAFDPQKALGGGQPTYFDQLATVYRRYCVNGAKITATFSRGTTSTTNVGPYLCGITLSDQQTLPGGGVYGALATAPNTIACLVYIEDGSASVVATYSRKKTYPDSVDNTQARVDANPALGWFAKVFAAPQGTDVEVPITVFVTIEFNVTFSNLTQAADL